MKILVTGAGGYLGRGIVRPFQGKHDLRLMDVVPFEGPGETRVGDVADLATVREAVAGMDALVIAHMASRQAGAYETPVVAFDANVKGTANLFFAAVEQKIKRICLISSVGVVSGNPKGTFYSRDIALRATEMYSLTKICQEVIAEQYHRVHGIAVSVIRTAWIVDADRMVTKYGEPMVCRHSGLTDPRDIGEVARRSLELPDLGYEIYYVSGTAESDSTMDCAYTRQRLQWRPQYDFASLPSPEEYERQQSKAKAAGGKKL